MKARCEHGRQWFGPCVDCRAEEEQLAERDGYPFWANMTQADAAKYVEQEGARAWRYWRNSAHAQS